MGRFDGKAVLITGGTSGIGLSTAQAFLAEGARVVIAGRRTEQGAAALETLDAGDHARYVQADVSQEADVIRAVAETVQAFGRLDCAVNCAGITGRVAPIVEYSLEDWQQVLDANLTSMFLCTREQVKQMLAQGDGGFIVHVSSAIGKRSFPGLSAYGATKRGLESLIETAAQEYGTAGIIINGVAPGSIQTPMFDGFTNNRDPELVKMMADTFHLVKRIGKPETVAHIILSLCTGSPHDAFVTGATIPVDGGWVFRQ